jgi:hypothetical protein
MRYAVNKRTGAPRALVAVLLGSLAPAFGCTEQPSPSATSAGDPSSGSGGSGGGVATGGGGGEPVVVAPDPVGWRETAEMHVARGAHTATLLQDGRVLVIGGELLNRDMLASVELYDPATEAWSELSPLPEPRSNHVAVLLPDGRVLIAGGGRSAPIGQPSSLEVTGSALLFDPTTQMFTPTGDLLEPRSHFQAALLPSGKVLAVGGGSDQQNGECNGVPNCGPLAGALATVEIYDPAAGKWSAAEPMKLARYSFTLTALVSGGVLAAGGLDETKEGTRGAELFDPDTGTWADAGEMTGAPREHHSATLLGSGLVLVAGGKNPNVTPLKSVTAFDPLASSWVAGPTMSTVRTVPGLVTLQSGRALLVGGFDQLAQNFIDEAVLFDEATWTWMPIAPLSLGRSSQSTTVLADGSVLVAGGFPGFFAASARCERTVPGP